MLPPSCILGWTYFTPQLISHGFFRSIPVSLIAAAVAIFSLILHPPKKISTLTPLHLLLILLTIWICFTTLIAVSPDAAKDKWNWAFKNLAFMCLMPLFFRSRVQLEAFFAAIIFALLGNSLAMGVKTGISGGGYGISLQLVSGNSGLAEGSTLAGVAACLIPICIYLAHHSVAFESFKYRRAMFYAAANGQCSHGSGDKCTNRTGCTWRVDYMRNKFSQKVGVYR